MRPGVLTRARESPSLLLDLILKETRWYANLLLPLTSYMLLILRSKEPLSNLITNTSLLIQLLARMYR